MHLKSNSIVLAVYNKTHVVHIAIYVYICQIIFNDVITLITFNMITYVHLNTLEAFFM
jgi:propanediol utilization protein